VQVWVKIVWENGVLRRSQAGRKLMGMSKEIRTLRYLKGAKFEVSLDHAEDFELDGDIFGEVTGFRTTIDPGAVRVRLPEGHTLDAPTRDEKAEATQASREAVATEADPAR
jgi:diacylglycerol kinase (ATP)